MEPEGSLPHPQVHTTCTILNQHSPVHTPPHPSSWRSILILSSNYTWVFRVVSFPQVSPSKTSIHISSPSYTLWVLLYGFETWSLTVSEGVAQNILIQQAQTDREQRRKLYDRELQSLWLSDVIRSIGWMKTFLARSNIPLSWHTAMCVAAVSLQHADLQNSASKIYWERERDIMLNSWYKTHTLCASAYKRHVCMYVCMCTQYPDVPLLRTVIQSTISENCKGCEKVSHRMSESHN